MFVRMALHRWKRAFEVNGTPVNVDVGASTGFLQVYETLEALLKECPEASYTQIELVEPTQKGAPMAKKKAAKKAKAKKKKSKPMY